MAQYTENYHLSKPDPTDTQSSFISDYCNNMDKIDQNMGGGGSSVSWQQLQVTGDKIATIRISGIDTSVYSPNSQTFSMAISRANINSDEKYSTIFGKIKKWFADLKAVAFSGSYNDLSNTPTKVSDFTNDSGFVTSTVNNLAYYYLKSETYTQAQVDALIGAISTISIEVVQSLPTQDIKTNTIYLVPKQTAGTQNVYDEYIYVNNAWELIGDTEIDLSNYVTTTDLATALQDYVTSTGLSTILANYYTSSQIDTLLGGKVNDVEVNGTSVVNGQGVAEVTVPTKTSDLNNDSGYLTDSDVSVTQVVSTGTKIATIDVNGTSTDLYAPASGGGSVNDVTVNGSSVVNAQGVAEVTAVQDNPTFTEAQTRGNIASGESFATILGKIKKFFTDLKTVAFSGSYNDLSDKPTIPVGSDYVAKTGDTMTGQLSIKQSNSTTSHIDSALSLGNNIPNGTTGCTYGKLRLWGDGAYRTDVLATGATANRNIYLPDKGGTVALTDDIPTNNNQLTNGAGYITSDGTSKTAKMLFSQSDNMGGYETNDTHILQLGYLGADDYSNVTLLVSSSFYGVQHGSTDILNVIQDYTRGSRYFYHVKLDGRTERTFYGEQVGDKFYIWVYCIGGNSYGTWNVSVIQSNGNHINWVDDKKKNQPVRSTWTEFGYGGIVYKAKNADSATSASYVKDYRNNTPTYFGYNTSAMAQSAATYLGAWDASVSGQFRLRAVRQDNLKVAYATSAGSATLFNGLSSNWVSTGDKTKISVTVTRTSFDGYSGFLKVMGDGNGSGIDFLIPVHSGSVGTPVGHWVVAPSPSAGATTTEVSVQINVTRWNRLCVITNFEVLRIVTL